MLRNSPFFQLYLARLREFIRQPARIFWVYGFPMLLAIVLGFAFQSRPPAPVEVDVVAGRGLAKVEAAVAAHNSAGNWTDFVSAPRVVLKVYPEPEALARLRTGRTPIVVSPGEEGSVSYRFDPTRPEAAAARQTVDDVIQKAAGRVDPIATRDELVTEPGSRYIDFLIPGLIGLNAMGGGLWGVGFFLVNLRIAKLLKCYVATPMPRRDFLGAILASRLTFLLPDLGVLLLLGVVVFQMPIRGSLALIVLLDVVGALAFAGLGLLIASRAATTETVSGLMNLVMMPMWLLSGVFFSSDRFPAVVQPLIQTLPLTQLVGGLRLVILEGAGLGRFEVARALAILAAWAVGTFWLALRMFKWS
ncbi:ABC transporter permease [Planctomyces sp. SH-PL62]|uniref:ABC transporter permease n=1 Tax=Planctomyces sp. SH-PL62 TaxID=1636152 RepID=UPI00078ECF24|nr:ABC transporter permease [Planctomyces sp. SH-PL62]AMV39100.1 Inner membrane transport permease YbhR [Planctomyces sp. SH-PL62]